MNQAFYPESPESMPDDFMATLRRPGDAMLVEGVYTLAALHHLVQCLQATLFDGQVGMFVISSCSVGQDWHELFSLARLEQHSLLILIDQAMPDQSFLLCMLGVHGSVVVYGSEQEQRDATGQPHMFKLSWNFTPSAVDDTLNVIEQHLILADDNQLDQLQAARSAFPLYQPDMDRVVRLFSELLAFAAQQEFAQATAYANLLARLHWFEDQTRMMVHDIRGPLHNLLASFKAMLSQKLAPSVQHELLHVGYESALFLENMLDTMMDALRLEAGKFALNYEALAIAWLVQAVCEPFEVSTRTDLPGLRRVVADKLPMLMADRRLLERILNNLIDNAIKFTPPSGEVTISAYLSDNQEAIEISVTDTGRGITPEAQPHIFTRFYQTREKDRGRGVGLGLYFCRVAVEAHGGTIRFSSTPGAGSTFVVVLPLMKSSGAGVDDSPITDVI